MIADDHRQKAWCPNIVAYFSSLFITRRPYEAHRSIRIPCQWWFVSNVSNGTVIHSGGSLEDSGFSDYSKRAKTLKEGWFRSAAQIRWSDYVWTISRPCTCSTHPIPIETEICPASSLATLVILANLALGEKVMMRFRFLFFFVSSVSAVCTVIGENDPVNTVLQTYCWFTDNNQPCGSAHPNTFHFYCESKCEWLSVRSEHIWSVFYLEYSRNHISSRQIHNHRV